MIDRMLFVSPSLINYDRKENGQSPSSGGGPNFIDLLVQTIGKSASKEQLPSPVIQAPLSIMTSTEIPLLVGKDRSLEKKEMIRFVLAQEGSKYVAKDGGGSESSKFGILQATAKKYNYRGSVVDMTRQQAEAIYEKIWHESGAQNLKPDLALAHFDTYVNSPSAAKRILRASNGDTQTYLALRAQRYSRLSSLQPERYGKYMKGWMNRIENLRSLVAENNHSSSARDST
jgi:lysozyme family protein